MANWNVLQESFSEGELSPRISGQVQSDAARNGLALALNALCFPQGPVSKRPGTNLVGAFNPPGPDANWRLWQFIGPDNKDLVAVFYNEVVAVVDAESGVISGAVIPYQLINANNEFITSPYGWNFTGMFAVDDVQYKITPSFITGPYYVEQRITNLVTQDFTTAYFFQRPYFYFRIRDYAQYSDFTFTTKVRFVPDFPDAFPSSLTYQVRVAIESSFEAGDIAQEFVTLVYGQEQTIQISGLLPGGVSPTGQLYVNISLVVTCNADFTWGAGRWVSLQIENAFLYARQSVPPGSIIFVSPYTDAEVNDLHFVQSPFDNRELIILHPNHEPMALFYDTVGAAWDYEPYTFTLPPPDWAVTPGNYPSIGAAVQGRLFLGGVASIPEKFWASETYNWANIYSAAPPSNKTDPLEFIAQERDVNTWIVSAKNVLYGDRRAEREIYSTGEVIAGDDIGVRSQTYYGAERMPQKILAGKFVVIATGGRTDLRLMFYSRQDFGYISPNIILKAEHLGRRKFKTHFFTRKPHPILWNVMDDGSLVVCSFDDEMKMAAWSTINIGQGFVIDGCKAMNNGGFDVVLLAVRRFIDGAEKICHENITLLEDPTAWIYTDATIRVFDETPMAGYLSGFSDLEGLQVAVFLDGQYDGLQYVTAGQVYVNEPAQEVRVGIPYTFTAATMPQASMAVQSGVTAKKRYSKVGVRGIFGLPPIINGQRAPDRSPGATMDITEPQVNLYDSDVVDLTTDSFGIVTVSEDNPIGITVTAIYGKLSSNQL